MRMPYLTILENQDYYIGKRAKVARKHDRPYSRVWNMDDHTILLDRVRENEASYYGDYNQAGPTILDLTESFSHVVPNDSYGVIVVWNEPENENDSTYVLIYVRINRIVYQLHDIAELRDGLLYRVFTNFRLQWDTRHKNCVMCSSYGDYFEQHDGNIEW